MAPGGPMTVADFENVETVGIASGLSTPPHLVEEVKARLMSAGAIAGEREPVGAR